MNIPIKIFQTPAGKSLILCPDIRALWLAHTQLKVILIVKIYLAFLISYMAEAQRKESRAAERSNPLSARKAVSSRSASFVGACVRVRMCAFLLQDNINPTPSSAERCLRPQANARLWDRSCRVSSELGVRGEWRESGGGGGAGSLPSWLEANKRINKHYGCRSFYRRRWWKAV